MLELNLAGRKGEFEYAYEFSVTRGISVIWGASGEGKSTLLRLIAGLQSSQKGNLRFAGSSWFDSMEEKNTSIQQRQTGYVPQNLALFPHLNVRKNLTYAKRGKDNTPAITLQEICNLLDLNTLLDRFPATLSGGEKQRVALGRAMMSQPELLLLDEPFSGLDEVRIREISAYIISLNKKFDIPVLLVTHSINDVARLADQVIVIESGRVVQSGKPENVLLNLTNSADGAGILNGRVISRDEEFGLNAVAVEGARLTLSGPALAPDTDLRILVHSRDVLIAKDLNVKTSARNHLSCEIRSLTELPDDLVRLHLGCGEQAFPADITRKAVSDLGLKAGDKCLAILKSVSLADQIFTR